MRKIIRFLLGLATCGVLLFAVVNLADYIRESNISTGLNDSLIEDAVVVKDPVAPSSNTASVSKEGQEADSEYPSTETAPIEVDFEVLADANIDIIDWLYCEDTPINLPVVQGSDNDYYLRRLFDGTWNSSGTLFVDYRNAGDFSDSNTIIYGHNMKNKEMFGTLPYYKEQSYFDEHSVMWLLTPDECDTLKRYATNGILFNAENERLKEKLESAQKSASIWKQRYEKLHEQYTELKQKAQPFMDALEIAFEMVRAFINSILARGKETQEHQAPAG